MSGIAIVGMSGRFPKARTLEAFWKNLAAGLEAVDTFTEQELIEAGEDVATVRDPWYVRSGVLLEDIERFDAAFFGMTPREAEITDPQQRMFLECCWEVMEAAGYDTSRYVGRVGVFAGVSMSNYLENIYRNPEILRAAGMYRVLLNNDKDHLPTRVSYLLNLTGPSVCVQAACSTSLVAVHLACRSLLAGECEMALAGGVTIALLRKKGYLYQEGGILSPDGHCRAFDAQARGTVGGSGAGVVLLKPLRDALADGDAIHAVILGSAMNNDGAHKAGYTAPSEHGQARVIRDALTMAGIPSEALSYVEAHGTATVVGDPIEIAGLSRAFATAKRGFCAIGSVKTNIGHLDAAAGIAGLIKTALALERNMIPPSLHFTTPNPAIDFEHSPFRVNTALTPWTSDEPRRAGVSSFGLGGTNTHVILEEAPAAERSAAPLDLSEGPHLILLSAKTTTALAVAKRNLAEHLEQRADPLADVAFTLQLGRRRFAHRWMSVCRDRAEALRLLTQTGRDRDVVSDNGQGRPVVFLFPGQGSQYAGMGASLYQRYPLFRHQVDECAALLEPHLGLNLSTCYRAASDGPAGLAADARLTQPLLFVTEYALAQLWMRWGVQPSAMIGHSVGEFVAATVAGVFALPDVLRLIAERARLVTQLQGGAMLAVHLSADQLAARLPSSVWLAASNGPQFSVASGTREAIDRLQADLRREGTGCKRLDVLQAFHSGLIDPILGELANVLASIPLAAPRLRVVSTVTGTWMASERATEPSYWCRHARETVRFSEAVGELLRDAPSSVLLEVGPGDALSTLVRQQARDCQLTTVVVSTMGSAGGDEEPLRLSTALGRCWQAGVDLDWRSVSGGQGRRIPLPTYPFERERFWVDPQKIEPSARGALRRADVADWFYVPCWRPLPCVERQASSSLAGTVWLVFAQDADFDRDLVRELHARGATVIEVRPGGRWCPLDAMGYELEPARPGDYEHLWHAIQARTLTVTHILHLWTVPPATVADAIGRGFHSLLFLLQAIARDGGEATLDVTIVSERLSRVDTSDPVDPLKSLVLGPCKVAGQELPRVRCRAIDLPVTSAAPQHRAALAGALLDRIASAGSEALLAWRGDRWWTQEWVPTRVGPPADTFRIARPGGVYLITGGLGGVGLAVAGQLAADAPVTLVLIGRSAFPFEDQWDAWLSAHGDEGATSRRIARLRRLQTAGATVVVRRADVADRPAMQTVVDEVERTYGPIRGVVHAAGIAGGGIIALKSIEAASAVLDPKVRGTLVLHEIFKRPLDFFVLCSSLNAIYGGAGQVDYCAANAFLDAYAASRDGREVMSINWSAWREVGMAADAVVPAAFRRRLQEELREALSNADGVDVLRRLLAQPFAQVAVSPKELRHWTGAHASRAAASTSSPSPMRADIAPQDHGPAPPFNAFEEKVAGIWRQLLGVPDIGADADFFEMGGHSLLATQVIAAVRREFAVELPLQSLFDAPTIAGFSKLVYARQVEDTGEDVLRDLLEEVKAARPTSPA